MAGWLAALVAALAGSLGGVVNAYLTDNGFVMPRAAEVDGGGKIWRPGVLGNVIVGAVAALLSWCLYGAGAGVAIGDSAPIVLTWAGFAAAAIVGIGGSRWLSAEVDKSLLRNAAATAAKNDKSDALATQLSMLSPAKALEVARIAK